MFEFKKELAIIRLLLLMIANIQMIKFGAYEEGVVILYIVILILLMENYFNRGIQKKQVLQMFIRRDISAIFHSFMSEVKGDDFFSSIENEAKREKIRENSSRLFFSIISVSGNIKGIAFNTGAGDDIYLDEEELKESIENVKLKVSANFFNIETGMDDQVFFTIGVKELKNIKKLEDIQVPELKEALLCRQGK